MAKEALTVKGTRFCVEFDHTPEDAAVGWKETVDLCSVMQEGATDGQDILCFLSVEAIRLIENALLEGGKNLREEALTSRAENKRHDRIAA